MSYQYHLPSGRKVTLTVTAQLDRYNGKTHAEASATVEGVANTQSGVRVGRINGLPEWAVGAIGSCPLTADALAYLTEQTAAINAAHAEANAAAQAHIDTLDAVDARSAKIYETA